MSNKFQELNDEQLDTVTGGQGLPLVGGLVNQVTTTATGVVGGVLNQVTGIVPQVSVGGSVSAVTPVAGANIDLGSIIG